MEYIWKSFLGHGVRNLNTARMRCKLQIYGLYVVLLLLLTLTVVSCSYAT